MHANIGAKTLLHKIGLQVIFVTVIDWDTTLLHAAQVYGM